MGTLSSDSSNCLGYSVDHCQLWKPLIFFFRKNTWTSSHDKYANVFLLIDTYIDHNMCIGGATCKDLVRLLARLLLDFSVKTKHA